jgi:hypothetical protein
MTSGGSLDSTGATALIAFALILGCFFASRLIAAMVRNRPKLPPLSVYGDFPAVPREMRPARNSGGGVSGKIDGRAVTRTNQRHGSHDHDGGASNS